jgi:hypothetical protein
VTTFEHRDDAGLQTPILDQLRALAPAGPPSAVRALASELDASVLTELGSIATAPAAAGLPAAMPPKRRWSPQAVVDELRRLDALGVRIRERDLRDAGHSGVVQAAQLLCGGLGAARRTAGIVAPRQPLREHEPWDAERVVLEIQVLHTARRSIASSKVAPRLYLAARRYFGGWAEAVAAAGIAYEQVRMTAPSLSSDQLLDELRALAAAQPAMTAAQLEARSIAQILRRRFRSLPSALRAAGLADWPVRQRRPLPSPEQTMQAIRGRQAQGLSLRRTLVRRQDAALVRAAVRHFASWQHAVAAAGVARA